MSFEHVRLGDIPDADIPALYRFYRRLAEERAPHEPPYSLDEYIGNMRGVPQFVAIDSWLLWDEAREDLLARGDLIIAHVEGDERLAQVEIAVAPERRRQGIGTRLLAALVPAVRSAGRSSLLGETSGSVPAAEAFCRRLGASPGLRGQTNELRLADVDRAMMRRWIERARESAGGFEMGWWDGPPYPEEHIEEAVAMQELYNAMPSEDLDVEDTHWTKEQLRQMDEMLLARGITRWTCFARETATGAMAGFTEVTIRRSSPQRLHQGLTAVYDKYRQRGLGRWLKAAMLERVLAELPDAEAVVTGNAASNEPMLAINRELGFRTVATSTIWQVPIERVESYLAQSRQGNFHL